MSLTNIIGQSLNIVKCKVMMYTRRVSKTCLLISQHILALGYLMIMFLVSTTVNVLILVRTLKMLQSFITKL